MKRLTFALLGMIPFATWTSAALVENGNFEKGVSYWRVGVAKGHRYPDPGFPVLGGGLYGFRLYRPRSGYL